jgi:hypothetical protein
MRTVNKHVGEERKLERHRRDREYDLDSFRARN